MDYQVPYRTGTLQASTVNCTASVGDLDQGPVGSGPFCQVQIRKFSPDPTTSNISCHCNCFWNYQNLGDVASYRSDPDLELILLQRLDADPEKIDRIRQH
jgi:hypothetical protein